MISCILAFYLALPAGPAGAPQAPRASSGAAQGDPDALYAGRADMANARRAEAIWAARLEEDPRAFDTAWKLARARYWIGSHTAGASARATLEAGIAAARAAIAGQPRRPEGHFWLAANMGALAESHGLRRGLQYRGAIKDALLTVLAIDPGFQQGSADRALGRWYYKVPALFGGSKTKALEHLRRSLDYAPHSTATHFFLAETFLSMDRRDAARTELQAVLDAPLDPEWAPEDREFKARAQALLRKLLPADS